GAETGNQEARNQIGRHKATHKKYSAGAERTAGDSVTRSGTATCVRAWQPRRHTQMPAGLLVLPLRVADPSPAGICCRCFFPSLFSAPLQPSDLAVEMPDFDVAAIDELPRGADRLRVGLGLQRPVRGHAVVSVDQIDPISRHGVLLLRGRQRIGTAPSSAGSHAGTEWNPHLQCGSAKALETISGMVAASAGMHPPSW